LNKTTGLFGSLFIMVFGLIFIGVGYFVHQQRAPYADGVSATAKVTGVVQRQSSGGDTTYSAVFTFTTRDNRTVTATESSSSGTRPNVGETVNISYRPVDPEGARIIPDHDWISLICYAAGGFVVLAGLAHFIFRLIAVTMMATAMYAAWKARRAAPAPAWTPSPPSHLQEAPSTPAATEFQHPSGAQPGHSQRQ
jgi:hypothetical protein